MGNITRTAFTRQYEHIGKVRHGVQTGPWRVEFDAPVKDETASLGIMQGSVVSINADGQYVIGCPAGSGINRPVPFISMRNITDHDVMTGTDAAAQTKRTYSAVGGVITAIPCTSGYELETTEFDSTSTYAVNDGLTAGTSTKIGKVVKATVAPGAAEPYLGFVSIAPANNYFGGKAIAFFTDFIPAGINVVPDFSGVTAAKTLTATNGVLSWA